MLSSTGEFVKNYYWRYVDMHINKYELEFLQSRTLQDPGCKRFLSRYKHLLATPQADVDNLCSVLSHINDHDLRTFMKFFLIRVKTIREDANTGTGTDLMSLQTYEDLERYIDDQADLFNLFVVSLYYYF
jgi:uncharacterized protein YbgA (DUF1722 family)